MNNASEIPGERTGGSRFRINRLRIVFDRFEADDLGTVTIL